MLKHLQLVALFVVFSCVARAQSAEDKGSDPFFTSFDGVKIHYEVVGNGDPVVLVHGFMSDGDTWKRTALYTDLVASRHKVIILDMRGIGKSDKPHSPEAYEHDAEAKDIMGLMTFLKFSNFFVVGYSRGSIITSRLLILDSRITKAVLGGMGADFTDRSGREEKCFIKR